MLIKKKCSISHSHCVKSTGDGGSSVIQSCAVPYVEIISGGSACVCAY